MLDHTDALFASLALFSELSEAQRETILGAMRQLSIQRGETLVTEGGPSESMFIVLHGAFQVSRQDIQVPIAEIHAGELIGEIGFLANTPRTATVRALRDSAVLVLDRETYARITQATPAILSAMLTAVSRRLGVTSAKLPQTRARSVERTIALVHCGAETIPAAFFDRLRRTMADSGATIVDSARIKREFGALDCDDASITQWLNGLEREGPTIVYCADAELTQWTRKCIRQADMVLMAVRGDTPPDTLSPVERCIRDVHSPEALRLVRVHDRRVGVVRGTAAWLDRLPVFMHHHVALEDDIDLQSLTRFVTGQAIGFVAGGGGGFGSAHVGVFRAFTEMDVNFDIFGGTSVGSAMLAGFAMLHDAERLDLGTYRIFVKSRSFKRPTWPRYALLDHKAFDAALMFEYGETTLIEDCWRPYFALATNLSTQQPELIRRGLLWRAVRASSAIPGVLPPVYTEDGMMLVDGGIMDNAPIAPMKELKSGPNVMVHFGKSGVQRFDVRYDALPGRARLIAGMLNPFVRLPRAPSAMSVLWRSLLAHQRYDGPFDPQDLVLRPPSFSGASVIDFSNHTKVYHAGFDWTQQQLVQLRDAGDSALTAIMGARDLASPPAAAPQPDVESQGLRNEAI